MGKTNEQVMEAELKRLKGPFYKPPLTRTNSQPRCAFSVKTPFRSTKLRNS